MAEIETHRWMEGYRAGLRAAIEVVEREPELPVTQSKTLVWVFVWWVMTVLNPFASRIVVQVTKASIATKLARLAAQHEEAL